MNHETIWGSEKEKALQANSETRTCGPHKVTQEQFEFLLKSLIAIRQCYELRGVSRESFVGMNPQSAEQENYSSEDDRKSCLETSRTEADAYRVNLSDKDRKTVCVEC